MKVGIVSANKAQDVTKIFIIKLCKNTEHLLSLPLFWHLRKREFDTMQQSEMGVKVK